MKYSYRPILYNTVIVSFTLVSGSKYMFHNFPEFFGTLNICCNHISLTKKVLPQNNTTKDADRIEEKRHSEDTDQTALKGSTLSA